MGNKRYIVIIELQQSTTLETEILTFDEIILKEVLCWKDSVSKRSLVPFEVVDRLNLYSEEVMCNHRNWHGMLGMQYFYTVVSNLLLFLT